VTGTTGSDGRFSITLPAQQVGTTLYVGSASQANLNAVETPLQLNVVNHPTVISGFKVSLDQYWDLSVSGCLESGNTAQGIYHTSGLTVQYASSTNGPWKKLGSINGNEPDSTCGTGGIKFTGSFIAPENYAYYRVVYAGTCGIPTSYASTTSPSILTWRYYDRITGLKVSPTVVNAGGKLTIAGTLQYYYSGLLRADPADERTLAEFGMVVGASERTLSRLFRQEAGMSFPQWRTQFRLQHALVLLADGTPVTTTALACGWANPSSFIETFRRAFGATPGRFYTRAAPHVLGDTPPGVS